MYLWHHLIIMFNSHEGKKSDSSILPVVQYDGECFEPLYMQAMKKSEDGKMTVIRLCEQDGRRGRIALSKKVKLLNLLEEPQGETDVIEFSPFEIITIGVE